MSYKVFVYGSLKKGFANHRCLAGATFLGSTTLRGFEMYSLGGYPGACVADAPGQSPAIDGEVYVVNDVGLAVLDRLESNGSFYTRQLVATEFGAAWIYLIERDRIRFAPRVWSGRWEDPRLEQVQYITRISDEDEESDCTNTDDCPGCAPTRMETH